MDLENNKIVKHDQNIETDKVLEEAGGRDTIQLDAGMRASNKKTLSGSNQSFFSAPPLVPLREGIT